MNKIIVDNIEYEIIEDEKKCFNYEEFSSKYTDYFYEYDYILGDYAYNKLRLKGFCNKSNKNFNKYNDFNTLNSYVDKRCAYKCSYFVLKRVK